MEEVVTYSVEERVYRGQSLCVPKLLDSEGAEIPWHVYAKSSVEETDLVFPLRNVQESQVKRPQREHDDEDNDAVASILLLADRTRVKKG